MLDVSRFFGGICILSIYSGILILSVYALHKREPRAAAKELRIEFFPPHDSHIIVAFVGGWLGR
jgi:hypothetical protein